MLKGVGPDLADLFFAPARRSTGTHSDGQNDSGSGAVGAVVSPRLTASALLIWSATLPWVDRLCMVQVDFE